MNSSHVTVFGALSTKQSVRIFYNILTLKQLSPHNVMPKFTNNLGELSFYICCYLMQIFNCSTKLTLYILPSAADVFFNSCSSSSTLSLNHSFFSFNHFTVSIRESTFSTRRLFLPDLFCPSSAYT